ncbi:NAD(P)/FAD-dependent oxidoreductase [Alkaliphilus crotonatoxidans]
MKVAIIGAGTAGLSCAIELERHGIYPTIFERNDFIGEYHPHVSAFLGLLTRPVSDPIQYINQQLGITLKPLGPFRKVIHYSPNNQATVSGQLGHFMIRGKEENSVKNQLHKQVKSQVHFNCNVHPEDIEKDFDFIVAADGHWFAPTRYGIWQEVMRAWLSGGVFEGDFEPDTLKMWLDNDLTKGAYIYLAPYSKNKAVIAHVVQGIQQNELNQYWRRFLESRDILKQYNMVESWSIPHHAGLVTTNRVGKVYFAGAAGGGVEPFLGFGQFNAIVSGVMVAKSIAKGYDIDQLLGSVRKKSQQLKSLRPLLNAATNEDFDRLLTVMKTPSLRSLIYRTNVDVIKLLSRGLNLVSNKKNQ